MEIQQKGQQGKTQAGISAEPGGKAPGQVHVSLQHLGGLNFTPGAKAEAEFEAGG